jgi:hypothetical protein
MSGVRRPRTARELEVAAAARSAPPAVNRRPAGSGVIAMLVRRGFQPVAAPADLPFAADLPEPAAARLADRLGHYAFRLFLRGAIQRASGFRPEDATRYLTPAAARAHARWLVRERLAVAVGARRFRLSRPARSFGGTLEWYVSRELRERLGFEVETGLRFRAPGVGGDLDVVAAAEGRLIYAELKSSPPRNLSAAEIAAFFDRVRALRPDVALFVMDTALRLSDKVVPMLVAELLRRGASAQPKRVVREVWSLTPHCFAVNAKSDLMSNVGRAIAEGLRALAPPAL